MTRKGEQHIAYLNLRGVGFVMTCANRMLAFMLESLESANTRCRTGIDSICSKFSNQLISLLVIRGGEEGKKGMTYGTFPSLLARGATAKK